jgi:hypothetical protein
VSTGGEPALTVEFTRRHALVIDQERFLNITFLTA